MTRRSCYLAAAALAVLFVAVGSTERAWATDVDVSVTSGCTNGRWVVIPTANNTHTAPLKVRFDNSVELVAFDLGAKGTASAFQTSTINPPGATFHYIWSSSDAHLVGTLTGTLSRPDGCGGSSTSIVPTTEVTTSPTTASSPTTTPNSSSIATLPVPPASSVVGNPPSTAAGTTPVSPTSVTTAPHINLPTTGTDWPVVAATAITLTLIGAALTIATRKKAT